MKIPSLAVVSEVYESLQDPTDDHEETEESNNNLLVVPGLRREHIPSETSVSSIGTDYSIASSIILEDENAEDESEIM